MTTPAVLFLIFNRPDVTTQVMEAIRHARPARLYIAADGPRSDRKYEAALCEEARRVAAQVDWPCKVRKLFRNENLGYRQAVSSAIDWFFEHEEEGVILEDNCLPSADFFPYCAELLAHFRDDERVMAICGSSYADPGANYPASYYFCYYADIWGWATWRRAWRMYDRDLSRWPIFKRCGGLQVLAGERSWHQAYWADKFDAVHAYQIETWDYQWVYSVIDQHGLACYPVRNLVSNLGLRHDATHTLEASRVSNLPHANLEFPLAHPLYVGRMPDIERTIESKRLGLVPPAPTRASVSVYVEWLVRHILPDSLVGMLEYYCWPEHGVAWGGPFNGQQGRRAIFDSLIETVKPVAILETGTYRGTTTELFASTGLPVRTVEKLARNFGFAHARLRRYRNVVVSLGDSRKLLRDWVGRPDAPFLNRRVLAYLDAHWSADLPLAEELDILFDHCPAAIAMVDDFAVPGDAGYGYDDFGTGKVLTFAYIVDVVAKHDLSVFYPTLPSVAETGSRRGCVVLCKTGVHTAALETTPLLQHA